MARLEIIIGANNTELKKILKDSNIELSNFKRNIEGIKLDFGASKAKSDSNAIKTAISDQRIELAKLKTEYQSITNAAKTSYEQQRQETIKLKTEQQSLINQNQALKNSQAQVEAEFRKGKITEQEYRIEAARLSLELKALSLEQRKTKQNVDVAEGSYREAQQRLTALGKAIREAKNGFSTMSPAVSSQIKEYNDLNSRLKAFDMQMGNHQRSVGNYALAQGNANGVAMEFNRIIQDAPFGMMGIGNNIQQLSANWQSYTTQARQAAVQTGKTVTTMGLMKGAMSTILSPANLLTLGIAAITSGWVLYDRWAQKAKKATEETTKTFDDLIKAMDAVRGAIAKGESDSQKQLTDLRLLYDATQNSTLSLEDRQKAVDALQKQFPSYFGNLKDETILAGQAKGAYDKLSNSILVTAQARAEADRIIDNSKKILQNKVEIEQQQELLNKAEQQIKIQKAMTGIFDEQGKQRLRIGRDTPVADEGLTNAIEERNKIAEEQLRLGNENKKLTADNTRLAEGVTQKIKEGADVTLQFSDNVAKVSKNMKAAIDYASQLQSIIRRSDNPAEQSGLTGSDVETEKIRQRYEKLYSDLTTFETKLTKDTKINSDLRKVLLEQASNARTLFAANEAQEQIQADKDYRRKVLVAEKELWDKINSFRKFSSLSGDKVDHSNKLEKEYDKKINAVREAFAKLKKLAADNPTALTLLGMKEAVVMNDLKIQEGKDKANEDEKLKTATNKEDEAELNRILSRSVQRFGREFYDIVSDLGQYSEDTFKGAISNVISRLTSSFGDVFTSVLGVQFKDVVKDGMGDLSSVFGNLNNKVAQSIVAGAGIAGGIISGAMKPTSSLGQGAGGAISGAMAGLAIGSGIPVIGSVTGAIVGGLVGAIGGIFGASAARKKEEQLLQQQLDESKKQTELMRKSALAFTSAIIGQMTNQGIVRGVERNELGDIVFRIEGDSLVAVGRRAEFAQERGV